MTTAADREAVVGFIEAMGHCNPEAAAPFMADDFSYKVMKHPFDLRQDKEGLLNTIADTAKLIPGGIKPTIRSILADGDRIVVEAMGNGLTVDGRPYDNAYCWFFSMSNGRIKNFWQYLCTEYASTAFAPAALTAKS